MQGPVAGPLLQAQVRQTVHQIQRAQLCMAWRPLGSAGLCLPGSQKLRLGAPNTASDEVAAAWGALAEGWPVLSM